VDKNEEEKEKTIIGSYHISLGSPNSLISLADTERIFSGDMAFTNFCIRLAKTLSVQLGMVIKLNSSHMVCEF